MSHALRCLVFGGSGALGRVVCEMLAQQGARVAFTYHTRETAARDLASNLPGGRAWPLDFSSVKDIERIVGEVAAAWDGIEAFVQCAGVAVTTENTEPRFHTHMSDVDEDAWDRMMNVNVKSTFFAVRRIASLMKRNGGGNIVLIGSIDGVKPVPAPVHYAASKGALGAMTRAMAKELGEYKIRVNMVAPGIMEDGISKTLVDSLMQEYVKHCGLKRVGKLSEIASIVAWFAQHNTYVTGQIILADGGL
jgi:3-oxoacyl-[acyl-carrier protein] reductase